MLLAVSRASSCRLRSYSNSSLMHDNVCRMIAAGDVDATIDEGEGMVKFCDNKQPENVSPAKLQERITKIATLQSLLVESTRSAQLEHKYVANLVRNQDISHPVFDSSSLQATSGVQPDAMDVTPDLTMGDL